MNPARSLGPDIVGADFNGWWIYVAGPVIGGSIAVILIMALRDFRPRLNKQPPKAGIYHKGAKREPVRHAARGRQGDDERS